MKRIWIPQTVISAFLLWALYPENPYGYYVFLRFITCLGFGYLTILHLDRERQWLTWTLGITAVVYNPFFSLHLGRDIWSIVNIATIVVAIISIVFMNDWKGVRESIANFLNKRGELIIGVGSFLLLAAWLFFSMASSSGDRKQKPTNRYLDQWKKDNPEVTGRIFQDHSLQNEHWRSANHWLTRFRMAVHRLPFCHDLSWPVMTCHDLSRPVTTCHDLSRPVTTCDDLWRSFCKLTAPFSSEYSILHRCNSHVSA